MSRKYYNLLGSVYIIVLFSFIIGDLFYDMNFLYTVLLLPIFVFFYGTLEVILQETYMVRHGTIRERYAIEEGIYKMVVSVLLLGLIIILHYLNHGSFLFFLPALPTA